MSVHAHLDLHLHTTASDGQFTPAEIVRLARERRLTVIAITDHDTTAGVAEAQAAARVSDNGLMNPMVIAGIELSAEDEVGDVHILGYWLDISSPRLQTALAKFRQDRADRARRIVEKLAALGMPIRYERVLEIAAERGSKHGAIGRPHIARALIEAGYAETIADAFARFLNPGMPAYVARERLSPEGAVTLIHSAGGVAVLAHPGKLPDYRPLIARLIPAGLDGIEVVHPANDEHVRLDVRGLATQHRLIMTGGSDFHAVNEDGSMNIGMFNPPPECWIQLRDKAATYARALHTPNP